jgi:hypothetical protein
VLGAQHFAGVRAEAALQRIDQRLIGNSADLYVVGFIEMRLGIADPIGPGRVVGEEQEALAGLVEAADG